MRMIVEIGPLLKRPVNAGLWINAQYFDDFLTSLIQSFVPQVIPANSSAIRPDMIASCQNNSPIPVEWRGANVMPGGAGILDTCV